MFARLIALIALCLSLNAWAAVDANKASVAELDGVKGIGPAMSARIVTEREKAPFKDWHDFAQRVSGVGEKTAEKLSAEGLTINGRKFSAAAYAKAQARQDKAKNKADNTSAERKPASKPAGSAPEAAPTHPALGTAAATPPAVAASR
ncbi:MAG: ComEA family DNA-binding protein [Burkholderiaceae bacterium]